MIKPIVHYKSLHGSIVVGQSATVFPVDHPDAENVSNTTVAFTSNVVSYSPETGEFETMNTRYVPLESKLS